jgi:hypothetical protein
METALDMASERATPSQHCHDVNRVGQRDAFTHLHLLPRQLIEPPAVEG